MVVRDHHVLILLQGAALDPTDPDPTDEVVIVDRGDQQLQFPVLVPFGGGDIVEDGIEQRAQIGAGGVRVEAGGPGSARAVEDRGVELFVGGVQFHQKLQHLVLDLVEAGVGAVDLVDDHDHAVVQGEGALQHEPGLGHRSLGGVDQQDNAVHHLQDAFDFAAEIGVTRGVDDIDLHAVVVNGGVLRQDRDAALALDIARVHHALGHRLILAVHAALPEHLVDERGLSVVNVRDDRNVAKVCPLHILPSFS